MDQLPPSQAHIAFVGCDCLFLTSLDELDLDMVKAGVIIGQNAETVHVVET